MDSIKEIGGHVGEQLSGYLDGELTQQQRQRIELHVDSCGDCAKLLEELRTLRSRLSQARLSPTGEDQWREMAGDPAVRAGLGIGWVLLIAGVLLTGGFVVFHFLTDDSVGGLVKFMVGAFYLGLAVLFVSVLRQRLIERRTDRYKDVEI